MTRIQVIDIKFKHEISSILMFLEIAEINSQLQLRHEDKPFEHIRRQLKGLEATFRMILPETSQQERKMNFTHIEPVGDFNPDGQPSAPVVVLVGDQVMTDSLRVAKEFDRQHQHVLRDIKQLDCSDEFNRSNFGPISYKDSRNREQQMFQMTRDGFMFLVMGYTGKRAARIKEWFISEFNRMEEELRGRQPVHPLKPTALIQLIHQERMGSAFARKILLQHGYQPAEGVKVRPALSDKDEMLSDWLEAECEVGDFRSSSSELYQNFCTWCKRSNKKEAPSQIWFGKAMSKRFKRVKSANIYYQGLKLKVFQ